MFIIKFRRDHSSEWIRINPVLREGEPGYEKNTGLLKMGNGVASWTELPYLSSATLLEHINSALPHTIYDDGPSLLLLYENAKV